VRATQLELGLQPLEPDGRFQIDPKDYSVTDNALGRPGAAVSRSPPGYYAAV
jgi:hypothetical protein